MIVAIVNDNIVTEVRTITEEEYSSIHSQLCIDITDENPKPLVGWVFDGSKLTGPTISTRITRLSMRQRFTISELTEFYTQAKTSIFFQLLLDNLAVATFIDLQRPDTIAAINCLVTAGIITADRATQILTTPPTEVELYRGL